MNILTCERTKRPGSSLPQEAEFKFGHNTCLQRFHTRSVSTEKSLGLNIVPKVLLSAWKSGPLLDHRIRETQGILDSMWRRMAKERTRLSRGPGAQRGLLGESSSAVIHPRANFSMETEERGADTDGMTG